MSVDDWATAADIAAETGISIDELHAAFRAGDLFAVRTAIEGAGGLLLRRTDVARWVASRASGTTT